MDSDKILAVFVTSESSLKVAVTCYVCSLQ